MNGSSQGENRGEGRVFWVVCVVLGGALALVWVGDRPGQSSPGLVPAASLSTLAEGEGEVDPDCVGLDARPEDEVTLRRDLDRVRRVGTLNRDALDKLRSDRRWTKPELHDGLESAVADTMAMIDDADAEADCLEETLEELAN